MEENPYARIWKRGRPSKEALELRRKEIEWNVAHRPKHSLLDALIHTAKQPGVVDGKILYIPRSR